MEVQNNMDNLFQRHFMLNIGHCGDCLMMVPFRKLICPIERTIERTRLSAINSDLDLMRT